MRAIDKIVIHCSATPAGRDIGKKEIDLMHRQRGMLQIGYHYVIRLDGTVEKGRDESVVGAHAMGHNATSIGICYVGGVDVAEGKGVDTRTFEQKRAMAKLAKELLVKYPRATVLGHRDLPSVAKDCPSFDVKKWWASQSK